MLSNTFPGNDEHKKESQDMALFEYNRMLVISDDSTGS